jgi:hypothetical protein
MIGNGPEGGGDSEESFEAPAEPPAQPPAESPSVESEGKWQVPTDATAPAPPAELPPDESWNEDPEPDTEAAWKTEPDEAGAGAQDAPAPETPPADKIVEAAAPDVPPDAPPGAPSPEASPPEGSPQEAPPPETPPELAELSPELKQSQAEHAHARHAAEFEKIGVSNPEELRQHIEDVRTNAERSFEHRPGVPCYGKSDAGDGREGTIVIDNPQDAVNGGTAFRNSNIEKRMDRLVYTPEDPK